MILWMLSISMTYLQSLKRGDINQENIKLIKDRFQAFSLFLKKIVSIKQCGNLVSRAHVPFGQHQDTKLWNNQQPRSQSPCVFCF